MVSPNPKPYTDLTHSVADCSRCTLGRRAYFILLSWLPTYFMGTYSINLRSSSAFTFLPWLTMALGSSLSGVLADAWLARYVVQRASTARRTRTTTHTSTLCQAAAAAHAFRIVPD